MEMQEIQEEVNKSRLLRKLHLDHHTYKILMTTFLNINREHDHHVHYKEFLDFYGLRENYFSKMIFSRMDFGHKGTLDFEEYAVSVWDFLTLDLNTFVFHLYDNKDSGSISTAQFEELALGVYGVEHVGENRTLDRLIASKDHVGDGKMSFSEFCDVFKHNKSLQFPGYVIQNAFMEWNGGRELWEGRLRGQRIKKFGNKSIHEILNI